MALSVGSTAPEFTLLSKNADGASPVSLSSFKGKSNVVLLFFPGAFTTPCTKELCDVTSGLSAYAGLEAEVFGISCDTGFAQEAWAKQNKIEVTLLSDYDKEVTALYDVVLPSLMGLGKSSLRAVYVIDKEGVIQHVQVTPTPGEMPEFGQVLEALTAL
ncbi:MAG: redoxin domain-containing protein [Armatimonadetes bacterium]|nr:redoxin domain-containing protein [Armatimonadota bacterium]